MSSYECQFCENSFMSQSLLDRHKNTTKYCLELQGKELPKKQSFKCTDCSNTFSTKQTLNNHIKTTCKVVKQKMSIEKDKEIEELKNIIRYKDKELLEFKNIVKNKDNELFEKNNQLKEKDAELIEFKNKQIELQTRLEIYKDSQECLKEIAKQPKIQNNNSKNIQNNNNNSINIKYANLMPFNLTQEEIRQKIEENFTEKHLIEGQKGVAIFTHDNLLLDENSNLKYLCGDTSRLLFYYKNEDGSIQKDPKGTNLTKMIAEDVIAKSHKMVMDISDDSTIELLQKLDYQNIFYDIKHLRDNNGKFISSLSLLTSKKPVLKQINT